MRPLPVLVGSKSLCHLAHLLQGFGTMKLQTLLSEGAMISLDKAILLWVMWIADEHGDAQAVTKAHESGGKVTALGRSHPARVPIQSDRGR
jgi:hypothetical protein